MIILKKSYNNTSPAEEQRKQHSSNHGLQNNSN
ncbi:hypothetical protein ACHAXS_010604, partial [Conticribra weissflogii]